MIEIIGVGTMVGLVWLLTYSMTTESDAEQRRRSSAAAEGKANRPGTRQAA